MNVLFITGEYPPDVGGVGDYTSRLRAALGELGVRTDVASRRQVGKWDARSLVWLLRNAPKGAVAHIQYQPGAFDLLGDVCLMPLLLRARGLRAVTTLHDARVPYLFPGAGALRWQAVRLLANTSNAVVAADERDLQAVGRARFQVPIASNVPCAPPPGFDRAEFRRQLGFPPETLVVAYFGLLNASKGLSMLLDAFETVRTRRDARLLMLGGSVGASDATDAVTAQHIERRLQQPDILRTGYLQGEALSAHLLAADVALLPYVDGASPRRGSLLACAAHGLPIVSTQPVSTTVADAVLAAPRNADALAEAVLRASDDPGPLRAGAIALTERTSWRRIAEQHLAIYRELCSRR